MRAVGRPKTPAPKPPFYMCVELICQIRGMAIHQAWLDEREKEIREELIKELKNYHRLQQAWGLGLLKLSQCKAILQIWGQYLDIETYHLCQAFLGSGMAQCLDQRLTTCETCQILLIRLQLTTGCVFFLPPPPPKYYYIVKKRPHRDFSKKCYIVNIVKKNMQSTTTCSSGV